MRAALLTTSDAWLGAADRAASSLGATVVRARSAVDALGELINGRYTHLLLQPECAGGLLGDLIGVTLGEASSGIDLVLLGATERAPLNAATVLEPSAGAIGQAMRRDRAQATPLMPLLAADELLAALAQGMLRTHYQPVVRMIDRHPVGVEVLARLEHPTRGILPADRFVPLFEHAGLAPELTRAVAALAMDDFKRAGAPGLELRIALNFPLDVLLISGAMQSLDAQRTLAGIPAERIIIELTESRPVRDLAALGRALDAWRAVGYGIAIDDIGPGIVNHADLFTLPFTALKLDISVVKASIDHGEMQDFLLRIIDKARSREMTITAEGIEDVATWERMLALGIDNAQGFLIARPLPAAAVPLWMQAWMA